MKQILLSFFTILYFSSSALAQTHTQGTYNPVEYFNEFLRIVTVPNIQIPMCLKLSELPRIPGLGVLSSYCISDFEPFIAPDGEPFSNDVYESAADTEPFDSWFRELQDSADIRRIMTKSEKTEFVKKFATKITEYKQLHNNLPSFYDTINKKYHGDTIKYVQNILATSIFFNRRKLNDLVSTMDYKLMFKDEGFNFLISIMDMQYQKTNSFLKE